MAIRNFLILRRPRNGRLEGRTMAIQYSLFAEAKAEVAGSESVPFPLERQR
jgi:hypothetical protein